MSDFKIGEIVWTKLRGHPWWPSRIEDEETIPQNVLQQKPRNGNSIPVMFFGSRDYAWVGNEAIKSFEDHKKDFIKKKNSALFDKAVKQAMDPSILEKEIARERAEYEEEEIEEEEEEQEEEEDDDEIEEKPTKKSNKRSKKTTKNETSRKRRKEETNKSKNTNKNNQKDNSTTNENSKELKKEVVNTKAEKTELNEATSEQSSDHNEAHKKKEHKHKRHGSPSNYIYLKTRAKIQKLLTADFNDKHIRQKASDLLTEADRIPMTVEILKDTKIGKVVKKFSQIDIKNDDMDLIKRATSLLVKWKSVIIPHHKSSKVVDSTPNESDHVDHSENEISTATKLSENEEENLTSNELGNEKNKNSKLEQNKSSDDSSNNKENNDNKDIKNESNEDKSNETKDNNENIENKNDKMDEDNN